MIEESDNLDHRWTQLRAMLMKQFGKKPDLNAILFLIGIQELGKGISNFTKEEKQDLMHIATCKVFSLSGYYELSHVDGDGWPHYRSVKPIPFANLKEQDKMLRWHIIEYFNQLDAA
ncbi:hypothetical protein [Pontibacter sp. SGAir0037]|uniref:hypothetical protein n=1 Tax=Pontibacter sp. SGAir0037 TaxID=2571030 RepID=UPI0010CD5A8C|nr:hypothetical protein [Pontibacter sp. SGAir0037]QCR23985.1 hypothetical protein C1N53_17605 [Pontibacter sp. SGAir0037]